MSGYRIPKGRARVETRAGNSRFISTIAPAASMPEAQALLREIRAEMPDATHHVYAFRIGHGNSVSERMSDDGEPSGTAGPPALAILRGSDLGDVALVITRYFGGTKLGTGGLVAAYSAAARAALDAVETVEKVTRLPYEIVIPYNMLEPTRRLVAACDGILENEDYGEHVRLLVRIPQSQAEGFERKLADASAGEVRPRLLT